METFQSAGLNSLWAERGSDIVENTKIHANLTLSENGWRFHQVEDVL